MVCEQSLQCFKMRMSNKAVEVKRSRVELPLGPSRRSACRRAPPPAAPPSRSAAASRSSGSAAPGSGFGSPRGTSSAWRCPEPVLSCDSLSPSKRRQHSIHSYKQMSL